MDLEPSDEEVYEDAYEDESDNEPIEEDEMVQEGEKNNDEENDEYWGTSRADYYNADVIETEADALEEEAEARRLQQKQIQGMTEADFGIEEFYEEGQTEKVSQPRTEKLPELQIPESATTDERLKLLELRYPEFQPLAKDFLDLQSTYLKLQSQCNSRVDIIKFRAISAYLATLAMYFAIFTSNSGMAISPNQLREHPVMASLIRCRNVWEISKNLQSEEVKMPAILKEVEVRRKVPETVPSKDMTFSQKESPKPKNSKLEENESDDSIEELVEEIQQKPSKKKSKQARTDLQDLLTRTANAKQTIESDFGDEKQLSLDEIAEKAKKRKSLRFYASQIAQKANKRGAASRGAGGDDDLPHKERLRDRQQRLMKEAEKRGQLKGDDDLGGDDEYDDTLISRNINDEANEYYDMLLNNSQHKKEAKRARAEAYAEASKQGAQVYEEEQVGKDGKRRITYAIEKNKGLTPKRKKDVRNPRVKKRKKFDEKMKKLGSIRQVYKGGEGRGGYGGELTGIKTNLVRSVKL